MEERLNELHAKVEKNSERIDALEKHDISTDSKVESLCERLDSLISLLKYISVTVTGAIVTLGLFFIEQHI